MNRENLDYVQSSICYRFKDLNLLIQAFTRKSYSEENPGVQNNEVLEFYGDAILDLYVTKMMYQETGSVSQEGFVSSKNEGELTKMKAALVNKNMLAACIHNFGFQKFLRMGNGDILNNVGESISVREDLFEAIIGAVAVDSNWDWEKLDLVCKNMLQMKTINGYLEVMVIEKSRILGFGEPIQRPIGYPGFDGPAWKGDFFTVRYSPGGMGSSRNPQTGLHEYSLSIGDKLFIGYGDGLYQAVLDSFSRAYQFLCREEISRMISSLDFSNPVSVLHELNQKQVIMLLGYNFTEYHDENGNPIWRCNVFIEGVAKDFSSEGASKKEVKQDTARKALDFLVSAEGTENEKCSSGICV